MRTGGKAGGKRSAEPRVPPPATPAPTTPYPTSSNPTSQPPKQQQQQQRNSTDEKPAAVTHKIDLAKFRALVRSYIDRGHYETAIFWADKISTLSGGDPKDLYWMAYALYQVLIWELRWYSMDIG